MTFTSWLTATPDMAIVMDLNAERAKREQPDPELISKDDFGRPLYIFLLSYEMDDKRWGVRLWAYDFEDAEKRIAGMRQSLKLDGKLYSEIPYD